MKYFILPALGLLAILLTSCSEENPVGSEPLYDEPRFEWQVTQMPGFNNGEFAYSYWSPDTNEVFMCSINNYLLHYKDGSFNRIDYAANLRLFLIDGINATEGYLVGAEYLNGKYFPHIEKWNGNAFFNMSLNYNFEDNFSVSQIFVKSSNEIWISCTRGRIYKFDGYNLIQYRQADSLMFSEEILYDRSNKLRHLTSYFTSNDTVEYFYVYDFDGSNWIKTYQDIVYPRATKTYGKLKYDIFGYDFFKIYELQNNTLIPRVTPPNGAGFGKITGDSFDNIMVYLYLTNNFTFFHWNGQKWSNENVENTLDVDIIEARMVTNDYCCAINTGDVFRAYLYKGTRKK